MKRSAELDAVRLALPALRGRWRRLAGLTAIRLLGTFAEAAILGLTIPLLGGELPTGDAARWLARLEEMDRVVLLGSLMVVMLFVRGALVWAAHRTGVALATDVEVEASIDAMRSVSRLPLDFVQVEGEARILDVVKGASVSLGRLVSEIGEIVASILSLVAILGVMLVVSGSMVLLVTTVGCTSMLVVRWLTRRTESLVKAVVEREERQAESALAFVENQRLLRASAASEAGLERFTDGAQGLARTYKRYEAIGALVGPVNLVFGASLVVAGLMYAALTPDRLPLVLFFVALAFRLQPRFSDLDSSRHGIVSLCPDVQRLRWLKEHAGPPASARPSARSSTSIGERAPMDNAQAGRNGDASPASLSVSGLRYGYPGLPHLYDGAKLHATPGELVALAGESGLGKSTLLELLLRLRRPEAGRLVLDGVPVEEWTTTAWLSRVAWVPQRVALMPLSLRENLCLGISPQDDEVIVRALVSAGAHDFAMNLPEGLNTAMGRRGRQLSEGQLQRLGIARALLRRPGLLLLDEPTSALDAASAAQVNRTLEGLRGSITVIAVAHGPGIISMADRIIELRGARFVERRTVGRVSG